MKNPDQFDVIIIGGSYSGLAAGMALGRALRNVLIIDNGKPCNHQTPQSHNFLTNDGIPPSKITEIARQQVALYPSVKFLSGYAVKGEKADRGYLISTDTGKKFFAGKLIFATGIKDIMPAIPGIADCWGISVLHCPYCHGYEVRNKKTGILGNGDYAFEFSSLISNWTNDLTLYTNGKPTLTIAQLSKLKQHRVNLCEDEIQSLEHENGYLHNILFKSGHRAAVSVIYTRTPFVQRSDIPGALGCDFTTEGYIKTDQAQRSTVYGIFACGDNTTPLRTVANAVSTGTTAGMMVNKELIEETF